MEALVGAVRAEGIVRRSRARAGAGGGTPFARSKIPGTLGALGLGVAGARDYRAFKYYRRRKRWL